MRGFGNVTRVGRARPIPFRQEPARQGAVATHQHRGLRQQHIGAGVQVLVNLVLVPPGQVGHIGHHRHIGIVRDQGGNRAQVLWAADKPDFEHVGRYIFQDRTRLRQQRVVVKREVVGDVAGVAGISAGYDRHRVHAYRGHSQAVRCQAAGATGIVGVEDHHAGHRAVGRTVFVQHGDGGGACRVFFWVLHGHNR